MAAVAVWEQGETYGAIDEPDESGVVACYLRRDGLAGIWCAPDLRGDPYVGAWLARAAEGDRVWDVLTAQELAILRRRC